ncbi:hypothetical protein HDU96_008906, partial [Phlyctochytrium bullatum]
MTQTSMCLNRSGFRRPIVPVTPGNEWNSSIVASFGIVFEEVATPDEFFDKSFNDLQQYVNEVYSEFFAHECPSFETPVTWRSDKVRPLVKRFLVRL